MDLWQSFNAIARSPNHANSQKKHRGQEKLSRLCKRKTLVLPLLKKDLKKTPAGCRRKKRWRPRPTTPSWRGYCGRWRGYAGDGEATAGVVSPGTAWRRSSRRATLRPWIVSEILHFKGMPHSAMSTQAEICSIFFPALFLSYSTQEKFM